MTFHCLFEQSGTFKNEFKKMGYEAYDYDILNDFNETDNVVDLYEQIELAYREREREKRFLTRLVKTITYLLSFRVLDLKIKYY